MRFYTTQHPFYCGIDRHARTLYLCILDQRGEVLVQRHMQTSPEPFLKAMAPYRQGIVVAVEGLFTGSWLADLCADEGIPFVLGPALSMQALQGGKAKNDQLDAQKMAVRRRGGRLPPASVSPAHLRATRDLRRHRRPLPHQRAALLAHVHNPKSQSPLPVLGKKIAYQANRAGGAERWAAPAVPKRIAVALALVPYDDDLLRDVERPSVTTAKPHDAHTRALLHTVPGIGNLLCLGRLYDLPASNRCPRGQDVLSSCRLGQWAQASARKRLGTAGAKRGKGHLTWAFAAAAVLFLSHHAAAQKSLARLAPKPDQGTAVTLLAQKGTRAVYDRLKRQVAVERETCCHPSGRGAAAPAASLDNPG
jgi:Transposase/Transposase IS116/IS110/IS902 family